MVPSNAIRRCFSGVLEFGCFMSLRDANFHDDLVQKHVG